MQYGTHGSQPVAAQFFHDRKSSPLEIDWVAQARACAAQPPGAGEAAAAGEAALDLEGLLMHDAADEALFDVANARFERQLAALEAEGGARHEAYRRCVAAHPAGDLVHGEKR